MDNPFHFNGMNLGLLEKVLPLLVFTNKMAPLEIVCKNRWL
jgi:hypothetical protein